MFFLFKSTCLPHTVATRGCCYDFPVAAIFRLKISASGGDSVIGAYTGVSGCSACDAVLFSVAVGFFFCGAGFGFGGGLFGFRRSRAVSSRSLFFFLSSSRIAGRSSFGLELRVNFKLAQFHVGSPFRSFSIYGQWAERSSQTHIVSGNTCRHP